MVFDEGGNKPNLFEGRRGKDKLLVRRGRYRAFDCGGRLLSGGMAQLNGAGQIPPARNGK
jgi:hypothetical protein